MTMTGAAHEPQNTRRRLARDVGISVVANLVASGIVFLLGRVVGLLHKSPTVAGYSLVGSLMVGSILAGVAGLVMFAITRDLQRFLDMTSTCGTLLGLSLIAAPLASAPPEITRYDIGAMVFGVFFTLFGVGGFFMFRNIGEQMQRSRP
jgi:hypothetical protein